LYRSFADLIQPRDLIEKLYCRDLAIGQLEVQRLRQLEANIIKQARRASLDTYTSNITVELAEAAQRERRGTQASLDHEIKELKGDAGELEAGTAKLRAEFKSLLDLKISEIDNQLGARIREREEQLSSGSEDAALLARWIEPYERIAGLRADA